MYIFGFEVNRRIEVNIKGRVNAVGHFARCDRVARIRFALGSAEYYYVIREGMLRGNTSQDYGNRDGEGGGEAGGKERQGDPTHSPPPARESLSKVSKISIFLDKRNSFDDVPFLFSKKKISFVSFLPFFFLLLLFFFKRNSMDSKKLRG